MGPFRVVEVEVVAESVIELLTGFVEIEVDVFILDRPPQSLNEDVVEAPAPPIHADFDVVLQKNCGEGFAGELSALVSVEDLRFAMLQGHLQGLHAKWGM